MTTNNHPANGPVSLDRLSLNDAIAHADERADALSGPCAAQHAQLAAWLRELQERRKADSSDPIYQWRERYEDGSLWDDCTKAQYDGFAKKTDCEVRILYTAPPTAVIPPELHHDTQRLVTDFCTALAEKLYGAQQKYGYDADWKQDGWPTQCLAHFHQHIAKGDPRDVAAYCAFMWYHGWKTEPATAPVVPDEMPEDCGFKDSYIDGWNACRTAMLQSFGNSEQLEPVSEPYKLPPNSFTDDELEAMAHGNNPQANAYRELLARRNSPVTQDGYVLVPKKLTAENGAKSVLSGEFSETKFINCPECFGDDDCETCDGSGRIEITVPVSWTTIKEIWAKGVEHFAAAPKQEAL